MDQAALMQLAERRSCPDTQTQELSQFHRCAEKGLEGLSAWVFEQQRRARAIVDQRTGPQRPRGVDLVRELIFVVQPSEDRAVRVRSGGNHGEQRTGDSMLAPAPAHLALAVLDQDLQLAMPDRTGMAIVDFHLHLTMAMDLRSTVTATAMTTSAPYAIGS